MQGKPTIRIPTDLLDTRPGPYTMSFGFDPGPMIQSVRKVGVINPPLVETDEEGRVRIVAGLRRVLALKTLAQQEILCVDLSGSGLTPCDKLLLNFHDNLATRDFNGPEKGMALERLLAHFAEQEVIERYMPLLGLPAHGPLLSSYVAIGRLEEEIRLAFASGRISFQTVRSMLEMDALSRGSFYEWFLALQFNFNQQSQVIGLVMDLASISDHDPGQILAQSDLKAILDDPALNGPQKVKSAIEALRSRRLPKLAAAEKSFERTISSLGLPNGVRVHHSPYFESPDFRLEINFRDGEILRRKIMDLASNKNLELIRDPWKE
jgi:hypothetical protein